MPFEEFDKKIKEAADNHHPAYDENAWDKMEGLLNKHMPEKKERRRGAVWLLLLLITAGGAGYFLITKTNTHNPGPAVNNVSSKNTATETINQESPVNTKTPRNEENGIKNPDINSLSSSSKQKDQHQPSAVIMTGNSDKKKNLVQKADQLNKPAPTSTADQTLAISPNPSINTSNDKISVAPPPVSKDESESKPAEKEKQAKDLATKKDSKPLEQQPENTPAGKAKTKKGNGLFISLSAGPDVGAVELNSVGRLKLAAGVGIGYKISDRVSVQTGFYVSRKIYTAKAYDYHAPSWWSSYYPTLESVDADCKVYEIPLLVNYNFTKNKKSNWFGTLGLSSYLMKKEEYDYNYKTSTGQPASRSWAYNNENKHYFSVLTLAGGYERNLSNQLSLSFSPYVKVPLKGIGFGKVKLNSAGVMVSANFKPFAKK
jgi:hypothetical protein